MLIGQAPERGPHKFTYLSNAHYHVTGPREQLNQATSFIDGSTVYGFGDTRSNSLRSFIGGQLRMLKIGATQLLPPSTDPNDSCNTAEMNAKGRYCFESGMLQ